MSALLAVSPLVVAQEATPAADVSIGDLRVIGVQTIENNTLVDETTVGGFSGIDYDAANDRWVVLSDDRSDQQPARFYNLDLEYTADAFEPVTVQSAVTLLQANGEPYPNAIAGGNIPDPESIRIDPVSGLLWYTSEGARSRVIDPFIAVTTWDGEFVAQPTLPDAFDMGTAEIAGPRENLVFEGMTFAADGQSIWLSLEGPLYQDGPTATVEHGATNRITQVDRSGAVLSQFAYDLEPIPGPADAFFTTGVTEILAIDETRFLTIERTTVEDASGVFNNYVKVYEIDTAGATDVKSMGWLTGTEYTPVSKRLVLDVNAADGVEYVDNLEGITWGPVLENGNRSIVLVSDNNFGDTQITQFFAIEVTS
jgi:hypothetical protein